MRLPTIALLLCSLACTAQHPLAFAKKSELQAVSRQIARYPILQNSFNDFKQSVDPYLGKDIDVPFPKDPAGGYTHERHKSNYMLVFQAGLLYNLTGDARYAQLVRGILLKYAALNPTLKNHPQATSSSPGHIFWQALNDANWLVYCGMGYDLVQPALSAADRKTIETGAFKPEVDFFTGQLEGWFNLIHNHGVWACAGVGIVGIATDNPAYVKMALYGTKGDGRSGFLAQIDQLFSPDGYYTEGPYYVRYALLPFYLFANALNNAQPGLRIFEHRNQVLRKALHSGLQQTNTDGTFFPFNDDIKDKDFTSNELVSAISIAWKAYGRDTGLLTVASKQNRVGLTEGGAAIAAALSTTKNLSPYYPYTSIRYSDGAKGDEGAVTYLRAGKGKNLTTLGFKYASHGLSHGHFDELNFILFDKGNEVLQDYGSARFVNIEQKWGGRYLPENNAYATQTIAHNTVVVDEQSQFGGEEAAASKWSGEEVFCRFDNPAAQAVLARQKNAYKGVELARGLYLLQLPGRRLVVDIFHVQSGDAHQYDLPFQYNGQLIHTSFPYKASTTTMQTLGRKNGYQFLWKEAEAHVRDTLAQFTFLNGGTYYTISSLVEDSAQLFFTRTGANDPNFNLRREPSYIIRKSGRNRDFISVVEIHGSYNAVTESSSGAVPGVQSIRLLRDGGLTVAQLRVDGKELLVGQCDEGGMPAATHSFNAGGVSLSWSGPFTAVYDGKHL